MRNIRIIKTGINVSKIQRQLDEYASDWNSQQHEQGTAMQDPNHFISTVDVLQLVMGGIETEGQYVGDTELCYQLPALKHHTEMVNFLKRHFHAVRR